MAVVGRGGIVVVVVVVEGVVRDGAWWWWWWSGSGGGIGSCDYRGVRRYMNNYNPCKHYTLLTA